MMERLYKGMLLNMSSCYGLNCALLKDALKSQQLEALNMTIFGNKVLVNVVKLRGDYPGLEWALGQCLVFL